MSTSFSVRLLDLDDDFLVGWVVDFEFLAVNGLHPLVVDETGTSSIETLCQWGR